ncbi:unnamed protein product [Medioppia subpectinata]|uniref:Protein kinase domain-containing protein n=1 Tax=Medioppia subpectinata TaxID=1979941 RepID=A0A7R9KV11_9ACAR|nr:unnamed protein product [Medioppia subpectinata]CAG2110394.1 unnamed protein product [Medioppia subpectinata]
MGDKEDKDSAVGFKVGNRYVVSKYIAGGSFGKLYKGQNIKTKEWVAIKLEPKDVPEPQLTLEFMFYKKLKATESQGTSTSGSGPSTTSAPSSAAPSGAASAAKTTSGSGPLRGVPRVHYFGPCGKYNALVMDLLGPSLTGLQKTCGGKFSLKTTLYIAIQLMDIFEYFHGRGLIYRDTKPDNFLFGPSGAALYNQLYIIDMGLSKDYVDESGRHIKMVTGKGVTGTVRYMSRNNHAGIEQSRRDDMEAVGYMLVYLARGELPWQGVKADTLRAKYKKIGEIKRSTTPEQLCGDLPPEFARFIRTVTALGFEDTPKYRDYSQMFNKVLSKKGLKDDKIYDFDRNHQMRPNK